MTINDIIQFATQHQGAVDVATAWTVREAHIWWPELKQVYPKIVAQGGIWPMIKRFFNNEQSASSVTISPTTNQPQNSPTK